MLTIRFRSMLWFGAGVAITVALVWSLVSWRVFAAPGPGESTIVSVTPTRVLDTRNPVDLGLPGPFVSAVPQKLQVTGTVAVSGGSTAVVVPAGSTGVLLNVTVVGPSAAGFLSIRPGDAAGAPSTSSLNFAAGGNVPNSVQVALPTSGANAGQIDITYDAYGQAGPTTDVLIDIVGYTTNVGIQDLVASIATKADASALAAKADVSALAAKANVTQLPIAANVRESAPPDPPFPTGGVLTSLTIVAPVAGVVQLVGSVGFSNTEVGAVAARPSCRLTIGAGVASSAGDLANTFRSVDVGASGVGECVTTGAVAVSAGTNVLNLAGTAPGMVDFYAATLNALFVPSGTIIATDQSVVPADGG